MTLPTILLGLTAALLLGALFHALRGGGGGRLLLSLLMSVLGFSLGQAAGIWFSLVVYKIGALDVGLGAIGSVLFLILGEWLSRIKPRQESGV